MVGAQGRCQGVVIHGVAIAGAGEATLLTLCEATGGHMFSASGEEQIRAALCRIFWGLQYQDEILYRLEQEENGPVAARVQVRSDLGMAEDCLPLE